MVKGLCSPATVSSCDDRAFSALGAALRANLTLRYLDISDSGIGKPGTKIIAEALESNSSLRTLDLDKNEICDEGARAIARLLANNCTIRRISLWHNPIGSRGAQFIAKALRVNAGLETLCLHDNLIDDAGAEAIAVALECNNRTLKSLGLCYNDIGCKGAEAIARALKKNATLLNLELSDNYIGDKGAAAFADSLHNNVTIQHLDLGSNSIEDAGEDALLKALESNFTLLSFEFFGGQSGGDGCKSFFRQQELLQRNGAVSTIYSKKTLLERSADISIALRTVCMPIYVIDEIVEWEAALQMARIDIEITGTRHIGMRKHLERLELCGKPKRIQVIEEIRNRTVNSENKISE